MGLHSVYKLSSITTVCIEPQHEQLINSKVLVLDAKEKRVATFYLFPQESVFLYTLRGEVLIK